MLNLKLKVDVVRNIVLEESHILSCLFAANTCPTTSTGVMKCAIFFIVQFCKPCTVFEPVQTQNNLSTSQCQVSMKQITTCVEKAKK